MGIALAVASTLAIAVGLRLSTRGEALSHRVVVDAQGCGHDCDEQLARSLSKNLSALGFDAVAPAGINTPDEARSFARDHGARFAVSFVLAVEEGANEKAGGRIGGNALVYVIDAASEGEPRPSYVLRGLEEAGDAGLALKLLSNRLASGLFPAVASALLSSEPVRALLEKPAGMEQQAAAMELKRKSRDLAAREQAMRDYQLHCAQNDELLAAVEGGRCVSSGCSEEYLVGTLPDGNAVVVHDSSDAPVFPLASDSAPRAFSSSERLWLVPKRGARKLLAEAANFYSRPELSRDGSTVAFIEQRLGEARLYALDLATTARTLLFSLPQPRRLSSPQLSADGKRVLFFQTDEHGTGSSLWLAQRGPNDKPRMLLPQAIDARFVELALEPDGQPRPLIAALVPQETKPTAIDAAAAAARAAGAQVVDFAAGDATGGSEGPRPELRLLDAQSGEVVLKKVMIDHRVRALGGAYQGALLLSFEDANCGYARLLPGGELIWTPTWLCPKHIEVGPNGVYAHVMLKDERASRQLAKIDLQHSAIEVLTKSEQDVQNPKPAAVGESLAYERVLPRKYGEMQHVAVCFDAP